MKISPIELRQTQFNRAWRGYAPIEVDQLIDLVRVQLEEMIRENTQLKDELRKSLGQLAEHREREGLLKDTLLSAQEVSTSMREQGRREADIIIAEAEMRAKSIVGDAQSRASKLYEDLTSLRQQKARVRGEIRSSIETCRKWLEIDEDADSSDNTIEQRLRFLPPQASNGS